MKVLNFARVSKINVSVTQLFTKRESKSFTPQNKHEHVMNQHEPAMSKYIM